MESNKLVETEKVQKKKHHFIDDLNEILPIDTVAAILGIFFTVCSIIYLLIKGYAPKEHVVLGIAIAAIFTFLAMWVSFFFVAYLKRKSMAKEELEHQKDTLKKQLIDCRDCSLQRISDGFAYRKLLENSNIRDIETKMAMNVDPKKCSVLVFTSDLATLIRRLDIIENNIVNYGVNYRVIYFADNSQSERERIFSLIGKENLLDGNKVEALQGSKDLEMMRIGDIELIIYVDGSTENKYIQGFLSFDNVPSNARYIGKSTHFSECRNKCNYGRTFDNEGVDQTPFYKSLSKEKLTGLYNRLNDLFIGGHEHE